MKYEDSLWHLQNPIFFINHLYFQLFSQNDDFFHSHHSTSMIKADNLRTFLMQLVLFSCLIICTGEVWAYKKSSKPWISCHILDWKSLYTRSIFMKVNAFKFKTTASIFLTYQEWDINRLYTSMTVLHRASDQKLESKELEV